MIGRYGKYVLRRALIGPYDLLVLPEQSDWTIRLVGPESVRAIWLDDRTCWSWKRDLIGRSGYLCSGAFDGLLVSQLQTVVCEQQETIRKICLVLRRIRRSICCCAQNRQNNRHLLYYLLYPWWNFKTVHYAQRWSSVSVMMWCTCSTFVGIMIHR